MKTSNISVAQSIFLISAIVFYILAIPFGAFFSITAATICIGVGTLLFLISRILPDDKKENK